MYYYEVLVSSPRFHGAEPLTYQSENQLARGIVVKVPVRHEITLGVVVQKVPKPTFITKSIAGVVTNQPIPLQLLELARWLGEYYPAPSGQLLSLFLPSSLLQRARETVPTNTKFSKPKSASLPKLSGEQRQAIDTILKSQSMTSLLHGETGSGKTRVYLELALTTITQGRSAIILTPEIGLTPQLVQSFEQVFDNRVVVMHSSLSPAERRDVWLRILLSTTPLIVIGPRSALFTPLANVGLVVLDEAHDVAYKQEQAPHYLASRVAATLARLHGAKLVLGTATPLITDYFTFSSKQLPILRMQSLAAVTDDHELRATVVNLRDTNLFTRSRWLSDPLLQAIETNLSKHEQSLIFLNRRGTARLVLCQQCGWQALCPRCDLPLTYHGDTHSLRCHTCGHREVTPAACPVCKATDIVFRSIGTKSLFDELSRLFPKARLQRFDSDNKKSERLEAHYTAVRDGKVDILVGTQLLTKGLDLPKLSLVGIVLADSGLYFPDYTAEERTYQMLSQVMGRVGRGHRAGTVIIQTYHPESPTIQTALDKDFTSFYETQLKERELYGFPPFYHVLKVSCTRASRKSAEQASGKVAELLRQAVSHLEVIGPTPAFSEKANGKYTWQLIVKAKGRHQLLEAIKHIPANCSYDIDPLHLL